MELKKDMLISKAITSTLIVLMIQFFVISLFGLEGTNYSEYIKIFSKLIVGFFYLRALKYVIERSKKEILIIYLVFICMFILNIIFFRANKEYFKPITINIVLMVIPTFIYTLSIRQTRVLYKELFFASNIIFIVGIITLVFISLGIINLGAYSMTLSYYLLFPTLFDFNNYYYSKKPKYLIKSIISLIIILLFGSRGAILCIVFYLFTKFIDLGERFTVKKIIKRIAVILVILMLLLFSKPIVTFIYNFIYNTFGLESRTLKIFMTDIFFSSGRDRIYQTIISAIKIKPLFGYGLAGDRILLNGKYTHNIFLELIVHFGIPLGVALSILVIIIILRGLLHKELVYRDFSRILISIGFVHLLVSSTYLTDLKFWMMLGVILVINFKREDSAVDLKETINIYI